MDMTIDQYMQQICASSDAEERIYKLYTGKSGKRWLVADQANAEKNIYVEGGGRSNVFGGRTISFPLVNGSVLKLKAPWQSNPEALYDDTGIDVRDKFLTYVVIAKSLTFEPPTYKKYAFEREMKLIDLLYLDETPTLGRLDRGTKLAQTLSNDLQIPVICFSRSLHGGYFIHHIHPMSEISSSKW